MSSFQVLVDTQQMRLKADGVSTLVGAQDWDPSFCGPNDTFVDGITGTVFLLPACLDNTNWTNSNAGIFQKLPAGDFTQNPGSGSPTVTTPVMNSDGSQWIKVSGNTDGFGITSDYSVAANQAVVVEWFVNPGTANSDIIGDFGWGASGDYTSGVSLRFYADLSADVWAAGTLLGHFNLSGQNSEYGQTDGQVPSQTQQQYVRLILIPCRQRELLVLSSNGGGFSYIFDSIPEGTLGTITPSAPIWFYLQPNVDSTVRLALCQYYASGQAVGKRAFWRVDPGASPAGGFQTWSSRDLNGGTVSISAADGINPSSAYMNNTNGVRLNASISGSTQSSGPYTVTTTPFLYAARAFTLPQLAQTWGASPLDVTAFVLDLEYEASDSVGSRRARMRLKDPKAIIAAGKALDGTNQPGALIDMIAERPWRIYDYDGNAILEGINEAPKKQLGVVYDGAGNAIYGTSTNPAEWVEVELRDPWLLAENFVFKDQIPLDGLTLLSALTTITDECGLTDSTNSLGLGARGWNMSSSLATFQLPNAGSVTRSDFNTLIEPGDRASEWIDRLVKAYCANAFLDLVPQGGWSQPTLLATADLPSSPAVILYDSISTAVARGVSSPTVYQLFRKVDLQMLKPEANDIYVQGKDYRTWRPILSHKMDSTNSDPTVVPALRTPAWRGSRVSFSWNDPKLSTQAACNWACGLMYDRLTVARTLADIEVDFKSVLSRGSLVQMYFLGTGGGGLPDPSTGDLQNPVTCRVKTISARFRYTANDGVGAMWRPTRYCVEVGTDASMLHSGATDARSIWLEWARKTLSRVNQQGDATDGPVWRRPILLQAEV